MEFAEQSLGDLHKKTSDALNEHGIPTTPQQVNPHDETPLEAIGKIVGSTIDERVHGETPTTHVRATNSKLGIRSLFDRLKSLKKAA